MFRLSLDKIPFLIILIGLTYSLILPSTPNIDSPRFLCIYISTILSCMFSIFLTFRYRNIQRILLVILIGSLIIILPMIKIYFR